MRPIFSVFVLSALLFLFATSFADDISTCSGAVLSSPGTYTLTSDLSGAANTVSLPPGGTACIDVTSSDVVVDCQGHTITNDGTGTYGVAVEDSLNNVTVQNCGDISGYQYSIYAQSPSHLEVSSVTVSDFGTDAIYLTHSTDAYIHGNTLTHNSVGGDNLIYSEQGSGNSITANTLSSLVSASGNTVNGIALSSDDNDSVTNNDVDMAYDGVLFSSVTHSVLASNDLHSSLYDGAALAGGGSNDIHGNILQENTYLDLDDNEEGCTDAVANNNGSRDMPIVYSRTPVSLSGENISELVLCGAGTNGSVINHVDIHGSDALNNDGVFFQDTQNVVVDNSNSSDNDIGFSALSCTSCSFQNDTANGNGNTNVPNSGDGFFMSGGSVSMSGITADGNYVNGVELSGASGATSLADSTLQDNGQLDLALMPLSSDCSMYSVSNITGSGGRPVIFRNSAAVLSNTVASEVLLCGANGITAHDVIVHGSDGTGNDGFILEYTDGADIQHVNSSGHFNYDGFRLFSSDGNQLSNTTSIGDNHGYEIVLSENNSIVNGTSAGNLGNGFYLRLSSNNSLSDDAASANAGSGFYLESASNRNSMLDDSADGNTNNGFYGSGDINSIFSSDGSSGNHGDGFYLDSSQNDTIIGNNVTDNLGFGFYATNDQEGNLTGNLASGNHNDGSTSRIHRATCSHTTTPQRMQAISSSQGTIIRSSITLHQMPYPLTVSS